MANLTPVVNKLSIRLGYMLNDPPAAGADDGITAAADGAAGYFTATIRNARLVEGFAWLAHELIGRIGIDGIQVKAQGLIATQSVTASPTSLNRNFVAPITLTDTNGVYQLRPKEVLDDSHADPLISRGFAIEANQIYVYHRVAGVLTQFSPTATLYYVKSDRRGTNGVDVDINYGTDTTVDPQYLDLILLYAAWRCAMDMGAGEWQDKAKSFMGQLASRLETVK